MKQIWFGRISRSQLGRAAPNPLINQFASVAALYSFSIRVNYHFSPGFPAPCTPKEVNALTASFGLPICYVTSSRRAGKFKLIMSHLQLIYLQPQVLEGFFCMNSTFYSPFPPLIFFLFFSQTMLFKIYIFDLTG